MSSQISRLFVLDLTIVEILLYNSSRMEIEQFYESVLQKRGVGGELLYNLKITSGDVDRSWTPQHLELFKSCALQ